MCSSDLCRIGTPVADMLAHSPPLPLVIEYGKDGKDVDFTAEDEEAIILVLEQRESHEGLLEQRVPVFDFCCQKRNNNIYY